MLNIGNVLNGIAGVTNGIIQGAGNFIKTLGTNIQPYKEENKKTINVPHYRDRGIGVNNNIETGTTPQASQGAVPQETPNVSVKKETEATMQKELEKLYEREDAIRKETQEREDTAYQRAVADMRKAGIDPNLLGVSPAASGGGIINATKKDYTRFSEETNVLLTLLTQALEHEFTKDENTKNRIANTIQSVLGVFSANKKL